MSDPRDRDSGKGGTSSDDRNRGDYSSVGKDQDGKPDGSWWGSHNYPSSEPDNPGGEHHTLNTDKGRASWETDKDGGYVKGSGHEKDNRSGKSKSWD